MKKVFLDTETTGLKPGQIAQLSYIVIPDNEMMYARNLFFTVKSMDPGAESVHGLSIEKLTIMSNKTYFDEYAESILDDIKDCMMICHNVNFDMNFLKTEMMRANYPFEATKYFCTMEHFTNIIKIPGYYGDYKWPRLEELMAFLDIDSNKVMHEAKRMFGYDNITFHDARFDTTGLYMCYLKSIRDKYIIP